MPAVKTSSKGQIVIPKKIREKLGPGPGPGKKVLLQLVGEHAEIVPLPDDPIKSRGMLKAETSLAEELLRERRQDDEIEERRVLDSHAILKFAQDAKQGRTGLKRCSRRRRGAKPMRL